MHQTIAELQYTVGVLVGRLDDITTDVSDVRKGLSEADVVLNKAGGSKAAVLLKALEREDVKQRALQFEGSATRPLAEVEGYVWWLGKRVSVKFKMAGTGELESFEGRVVSLDMQTDKFKIEFDDGDCHLYKLPHSDVSVVGVGCTMTKDATAASSLPPYSSWRQHRSRGVTAEGGGGGGGGRRGGENKNCTGTNLG